jgi:hypothetical protein
MLERDIEFCINGHDLSPKGGKSYIKYQNIQYIKHSKYRQDSETSNYCFYKSVS